MHCRACQRGSVLSVFFFLLLGSSSNYCGASPPEDQRLGKSFRKPAVDGWTFVHLEGKPREIGYQHGYWLAAEIADMKEVAELELKHSTGREWPFFREEARTMMWPHIEQQYRDELEGIAEGIKTKGVALDLWDVVAMNGLLEWEYYTRELDRAKGDTSTGTSVPEHCSAFVATGSYTADGKVVIAHNNWSSYLDGSRWTIIFDIVPSSGYRILMDGLPGFIASDDDFGINATGIMITETTISGFEGYDPKGIPEFVRARKAMQYSASIDDFSRIMTEGNNGGYANDWLVADRKTNEIASLELGLRNVTLERTRDGYFVGANFPINPKLTAQETTCDPADSGRSCYARKIRWEQLMAEFKGRIDAEAAKRFMADHYDAIQKKEDPCERTLCGHVELSPRGATGWLPPYAPAGVVQSKVADSQMAGDISFWAIAGHACGMGFDAAQHLKLHPEFEWQKEKLKDLPPQPWTHVSAPR